MFLYSAHETNIALLLVTLDIFDDQIPTFGSYVIIEVHRVDGVYGFKVMHMLLIIQKLWSNQVIFTVFLSKLWRCAAKTVDNPWM